MIENSQCSKTINGVVTASWTLQWERNSRKMQFQKIRERIFFFRFTKALGNKQKLLKHPRIFTLPLSLPYFSLHRFHRLRSPIWLNRSDLVHCLCVQLLLLVLILYICLAYSHYVPCLMNNVLIAVTLNFASKWSRCCACMV